MSRVVVALGGNALGDSPTEQIIAVRRAAPSLVDLVESGHQLVLCHGNGPQVGMINVAFEVASKVDPTIPKMPFAECTAMSQGYIGHHLQQALVAELGRRRLRNPVVTVVTEVEVSPDDPAFTNPTKPVGSFMNEAAARQLAIEYPDVVFKEDSGRGWREFVPSPTPLHIIQIESIQRLVDEDNVVIACGGGGVPVVYGDEGDTRGVSAVIDKDHSAAKMAQELDADALVILTTVDHVALGFGTPEQVDLGQMTVAEAQEYLSAGQFAQGSMKPKIEAAVSFVASTGRDAVIGSLEQAGQALSGGRGTRVTN